MSRRVKFSGRAVIGLPLVALFVLMAVLGPWIAPYRAEAIDLQHEMEGPSARHWLGTGDNGVDILSVLLGGARLAGLAAVSSVFLCAITGAALGLWAGYQSGRVDMFVGRITDAAQAMPSLVLNVAMLAVVPKPGLVHLIIALSITGWVPYVRVARAEALRLRSSEFVTAARALGVTEWRVMQRHVLPNALGPLIVQASYGLGAAVLAEASLSFLGLGPGSSASWGALMDQGTAHLLRAPRLALYAGSAIAMTVLGFNLSGDWLRDVYDPRSEE